VISIQGLWKEFPGRPVLHGLDLEVQAGERIALVGPNGSGKTTLLRCLLGLLSYRGRISISGCDPIRDHVATQRMMAYVPQRAPALAIPVRDLARFWEAERGRASAELFDIAAQLGLDVGSVWGQKFTQLSGGMQQKLMAAMALASGCEMFLFDEPTANLDAHARGVFFDLLRRRTPAPTLVLSSHRLDELKSLVDRVIVLTEGFVVHDEPLDSLLQDPALATAVGLEVAPDGNVIRFGRHP
jgi:ABC-2 type transport system ATP-binding protein